MSNTPQTVHVFQCGRSWTFGFTADPNGANLPADQCEAGWRPFNTLNYRPGEADRIAIDLAEVVDEIAANGYAIHKMTFSIKSL